MSLVSGRVLSVMLVVACAGLGALIYDELEKPVSVQRSAVAALPAPGRAAPASRPSPPFRLAPIDAFRETVDRPLFNVTRRPIATESPKVSVPEPKLNIMLSGIVIGPDRRIVHLQTAGDKRVRTLGPGDSIQNWRIDAIEPDRVVLRAGARTHTVYMRKLNAAPPKGVRAEKPAAEEPRRPSKPRRNLRKKGGGIWDREQR